MFADVRRFMDLEHSDAGQMDPALNMLWMPVSDWRSQEEPDALISSKVEQQQRRAMDFCMAHYRTEMESKHCMEKILSGDVQYADNLTYVITPEPIGR
eukprot:1026994-Rhodomonas_salina.3